ncbi:MAG: ROK family protein [Dehalococcoidia bacterium]|nr:ROK family protein [Dehalococcoidia bacterium]MDW8008631.1 ROK family protein [Chloroflexota bacterium]
MTRAVYGAVDLGGTKVLSLVATDRGEVLGEDLRPTRASEGPEVVLQQVEASLRAALARAGVAQGDLQGVGIASPGPLDLERGVVVNPPNLPGWGEFPLRRLLEERLGLPVALENDATAAAIGEHVFGAGKGSRDMVFVTVGTGVGGGIICDGRPYRGKGGAAGELGHVVVLADGPPCGCGNRGCVEALASGTAIARRARELLAAGKAPGLAQLLSEGEAPTAETVHRAALGGDGDCRQLLAEAGRYLGIGLASYANALDPELVVLAGGVLRAGELFLGPARETFRALTLPQVRRGLRLEMGLLGPRAGALGMVAILGQPTTYAWMRP